MKKQPITSTKKYPTQEYPVRYEYRRITLTGGACESSEETLLELNDLGADGWLLVSNLHELNTYRTDSKTEYSGLFCRQRGCWRPESGT